MFNNLRSRLTSFSGGGTGFSTTDVLRKRKTKRVLLLLGSVLIVCAILAVAVLVVLDLGFHVFDHTTTTATVVVHDRDHKNNNSTRQHEIDVQRQQLPSCILVARPELKLVDNNPSNSQEGSSEARVTVLALSLFSTASANDSASGGEEAYRSPKLLDTCSTAGNQSLDVCVANLLANKPGREGCRGANGTGNNHNNERSRVEVQMVSMKPTTAAAFPFNATEWTLALVQSVMNITNTTAVDTSPQVKIPTETEVVASLASDSWTSRYLKVLALQMAQLEEEMSYSIVSAISRPCLCTVITLLLIYAIVLTVVCVRSTFIQITIQSSDTENQNQDQNEHNPNMMEDPNIEAIPMQRLDRGNCNSGSVPVERSNSICSSQCSCSGSIDLSAYFQARNLHIENHNAKAVNSAGAIENPNPNNENIDGQSTSNIDPTAAAVIEEGWTPNPHIEAILNLSLAIAQTVQSLPPAPEKVTEKDSDQ